MDAIETRGGRHQRREEVGDVGEKQTPGVGFIIDIIKARARNKNALAPGPSERGTYQREAGTV